MLNIKSFFIEDKFVTVFIFQIDENRLQCVI